MKTKELSIAEIDALVARLGSMPPGDGVHACCSCTLIPQPTPDEMQALLRAARALAVLEERMGATKNTGRWASVTRAPMSKKFQVSDFDYYVVGSASTLIETIEQADENER